LCLLASVDFLCFYCLVPMDGCRLTCHLQTHCIHCAHCTHWSHCLPCLLGFFTRCFTPLTLSHTHTHRLLELTGAKEPAALERLVKGVGVSPTSVNKDLLLYKGLLSKLSAAKVRLCLCVCVCHSPCLAMPSVPSVFPVV
jgi:hypothetical protein